LRSWICEYYHRGKGKKALWTVGDEIHADDRRYLDFDLWKNHFKAKPRDLYKPQGVRHLDRCRYTRWVALDVDNHGDEPSLSREEWLARYTALHDLLRAEKLPYLAQVNPRNGSYQLWSPVNKWPLGKVAAFAERVVAACPWVREIYPTRSKWAIICPFRPDKVNLLGSGELSKVKCRPKTWCHDLVAAWRWHRTPTPIDPDAVRAVLARSFPATGVPVTTHSPDQQPITTVATPRRNFSRSKRAGPAGSTTRGKFGPLHGRWLDLLSDTYLDAVEPPHGGVVSFLTPQLRLFRDGEVGTAREFLRDVVKFLKDKDWTFSDRVQNDPDDLLRSLDSVCRDRHHGNQARPLTDVDKARERLDSLGFNGSFDSLLCALAKRRGAGRSAGVIDRSVVETAVITGAVIDLAALGKTDHQTGLQFLRRVLNHIAQRQELSYGFLKEIASATGIRLSNYKTQRVFSVLLGRGLIAKTKNYSRCEKWSIGNMYAVTEKVQFVAEESSGGPRSGGTGGTSSSCNDTISRFSTTHSSDDVDDLAEYAAEVARLRIDNWIATRIRRSLAGNS
jgi:hypothetical protein